jgi:hypothetical protein
VLPGGIAARGHSGCFNDAWKKGRDWQQRKHKNINVRSCKHDDVVSPAMLVGFAGIVGTEEDKKGAAHASVWGIFFEQA